jgi:hypothetical protein
MHDDSKRPRVERDASPAGAIGGLIVGALAGAAVWALIALIISKLL